MTRFIVDISNEKEIQKFKAFVTNENLNFIEKDYSEFTKEEEQIIENILEDDADLFQRLAQ